MAERRMLEGFEEPVCSIETEQALLGSVLINNMAFHQVAHLLRPEHFYEPLHAQTWEAFDRVISGGGLADHLTMHAEIGRQIRELGHQGLDDYLARLARGAETVLNARPYAEHLIELAGRRQLAEIARDARNVASDVTVEQSLAEQLADLRRRLDEIDRAHATRPAWLSTVDVMGMAIEKAAKPAECWSTGLPPLDASLGGGLMPRRTYGVEARRKSGKTMLLGTIALHLMRAGVPFLYMALEMGAERILYRLAASETNCNAVRFIQRHDPEDCIAKMQQFSGNHATSRGWWADLPGVTFSRLRSVWKDAVNRLGVRVVIIDYWQKIGGLKPRQSKAEHLTDVAQWISSAASADDVAAILASQTNRSGEGYASDGLEQECDWLGRIHKIVGQWETEQLWIEVAANRDGPAGDIGAAVAPAFDIDRIGPVVVAA